MKGECALMECPDCGEFSVSRFGNLLKCMSSNKNPRCYWQHPPLKKKKEVRCNIRIIPDSQKPYPTYEEERVKLNPIADYQREIVKEMSE